MVSVRMPKGAGASRRRLVRTPKVAIGLVTKYGKGQWPVAKGLTLRDAQLRLLEKGLMPVV